jgi:hypothetical protein
MHARACDILRALLISEKNRRLTTRFPSVPKLDGPVVAASRFGVMFRHVCREN